MPSTGTKREWRYPCPKCGARVGETCTYLTDNPSPSAYTQITPHHAGDPCVRSHNERLTYRPRPIPAPIPPMSPTMRAYMEYDRREYHDMQDWLRANRNIFRTGAP